MSAKVDRFLGLVMVTCGGWAVGASPHKIEAWLFLAVMFAVVWFVPNPSGSKGQR